MHLHPPAVGAQPQPIECNVSRINKLHSTDVSSPPGREAPENASLLCCELCRDFFGARDGYLHPRGSFYCDRCAWELAERGEFYSGS